MEEDRNLTIEELGGLIDTTPTCHTRIYTTGLGRAEGQKRPVLRFSKDGVEYEIGWDLYKTKAGMCQYFDRTELLELIIELRDNVLEEDHPAIATRFATGARIEYHEE